MTCRHCARGGDLKAKLRDFLSHYTGTRDRAVTNKINGLTRRINNAHRDCPGGTWCDCQHAGTPHARRPESTPVAAVSAS